MGPTVTATPAPAQPVAAPAVPETQSATHAAVASDDTSAYRAARRAERIGKPLPAVAVATEPAPIPVEEAVVASPPAAPAQPVAQPAVSKRQEQTNNAIRDAVARAVAEKDAEIARLRSASPSAPAPAQPAAPAQPTEPEWKRLVALPDYPKLADFESIEEHAAAVGLFVADQREQARQQRAESDQRDTHQHQRISAFDGRVSKVAESDPDIVSKILPRAQELGRRGGPFTIISDLVLDSDAGPVLLRDHYDALQNLARLPESLRGLPLQHQIRAHIQHVLKEFGKLEGSLATPAAPATPAPKTLTDADEAPQTLGSRPAEATDPRAGAIKRGDTRAYREIRRQERAAGMRR